jgi:hypothetical protein
MLNTKYDMHQRVIIKELQKEGRVAEIICVGSILYYRIQYFVDGVVNWCNLYEDELEEVS